MARTMYNFCMVDDKNKFVGFLSSESKTDLVALVRKKRKLKTYKKMFAISYECK